MTKKQLIDKLWRDYDMRRLPTYDLIEEVITNLQSKRKPFKTWPKKEPKKNWLMEQIASSSKELETKSNSERIPSLRER
jgi:hypothetical protein